MKQIYGIRALGCRSTVWKTRRTLALVIKDNLLHHRSKPVLMKNNLPRFLKSIMEDVVTNADKSISIPEKRKKMSEWQNCFFIHWLPDRWKRWYRINFAMLPLWLMGLIVVAAVFVLYQFVTADLQPFIYFQF